MRQIIGCLLASLLGLTLSIPASAASAQTMVCKPEKLGLGDMLTVYLPKGHGNDFAIIRPDGTYVFISFTQPDPTASLQPLVSTANFSKMTEVKLSISRAEGIPWTYTPIVPEVIFQMTGTYRILVSQSLETEDPALDGWCEVSFDKKNTSPNIHTVHFSLNSSKLHTDDRKTIEILAQEITGKHFDEIEINGFADRSGRRQFNKELSEQRAQAVVTALVEFGVPNGRISVRSYGEENPFVSTADGVANRQNRRVDVIVRE